MWRVGLCGKWQINPERWNFHLYIVFIDLCFHFAWLHYLALYYPLLQTFLSRWRRFTGSYFSYFILLLPNNFFQLSWFPYTGLNFSYRVQKILWKDPTADPTKWLADFLTKGNVHSLTSHQFKSHWWILLFVWLIWLVLYGTY